MSAHASDEVALDFQDSLQDLQNNNRYEISNLTIIAKENTEHAQAISEVLEKHIKTVSTLIILSNFTSDNCISVSTPCSIIYHHAPSHVSAADLQHIDCPQPQVTCTLRA